MGKGEHELGLIASPFQVEDAAAVLLASRIDFAIETHEDEVRKQGHNGVVDGIVKSYLWLVVEGESHSDVSRVDVRVVVVKLKIAEHPLPEVGVAFFKLEQQHIAVVGCENKEILVVRTKPCALSINVV